MSDTRKEVPEHYALVNELSAEQIKPGDILFNPYEGTWRRATEHQIGDLVSGHSGVARPTPEWLEYLHKLHGGSALPPGIPHAAFKPQTDTTTKLIHEMSLADIIDEATGKILHKLIRGDLRDGVSEAVLMTSDWQNAVRFRKEAANAVRRGDIMVSRAVLERALASIRHHKGDEKVVAEIEAYLNS
jgi:hypothetical protein